MANLVCEDWARQTTDDVLDSKARQGPCVPYDCSEHPCWRSEAYCRWPKEKVRFVSLLHTWGEGVAASMEFKQQLVSSLLFALILESDPRGRAQSYIHAQLRSAVRSFGWQSWKLKSWKLILKAGFDFSRNLAPPKITHHTVTIHSQGIQSHAHFLYVRGKHMHPPDHHFLPYFKANKKNYQVLKLRPLLSWNGDTEFIMDYYRYYGKMC